LPIQSVAEKLLAIFENDSEGVFNVCSGEPISIRRLVEERIEERGSSIKINLGHYPYPDYEPMAFWGAQL
jgi:dTDP-6-deoxy-L-talose 4-dehydrogenase (NAD+)